MPEADSLDLHIPLTLRGSQPRKEARKLELLDRSHRTLMPGGKLAPTQPETPTATATKSRLSPWARGAHQAGSSRLRRPSTSPGEGDGPVTGSPQGGSQRGIAGTREHTCPGELSRLGLLPGQSRTGQPPLPQPLQHQRLCPLPGGAGPEAQEEGSTSTQQPACTPCRPRPTVSEEMEDTAPNQGRHVLGLRTPPGTLRRSPNTHPAPGAANPREPLPSAPHLLLPPPADGALAPTHPRDPLCPSPAGAGASASHQHSDSACNLPRSAPGTSHLRPRPPSPEAAL